MQGAPCPMTLADDLILHDIRTKTIPITDIFPNLILQLSLAPPLDVSLVPIIREVPLLIPTDLTQHPLLSNHHPISHHPGSHHPVILSERPLPDAIEGYPSREELP